MPDPDYGRDLRMTPDLLDIDPYAREVTGARLPAERMIRRINTPRGTLVGAPNDGIDLRSEVNDSFEVLGAAARMRATIAAELAKEEAADEIDVAVTLANGAATVAIDAVGAAGPFSLTLLVKDVTVALLEGP